jgi:hypothetical protein
MRIPFEQATREELLIACKGLGFDDLLEASRSSLGKYNALYCDAGSAFNRGVDEHELSVADVQAMIKLAHKWGYRSIDIADPDWINADKREPSNQREVWDFLAKKYNDSECHAKDADDRIVSFIKNESLPAHVRFCMVLIYEGAHILEEEDDEEIRHELAQDDEYKLQEIADFLSGLAS